MLIGELVQNIHLGYTSDTSYPAPGDEEYTLYLSKVRGAINVWEQKAREGAVLKPLITAGSIVTGGTGTDPMVADFLNFIRERGKPAYITDGSKQYREISVGEGWNMVERNATAGDVFWLEGGNIRTLPAASGTLTFPYLRKATRYTTGTETTPIEIENPIFLEEYAIAQMFLRDVDMNQYQAHINIAEEILDELEVSGWMAPAEDNNWGLGM